MCEEKKIKVLHIITRLIIGGAQENTLFTVNGLSKQKDYLVTLLSGPELGPEGSLTENAKKTTNLLILPELRRNINPLLDFFALIKLWLFIKKGEFNIVHTHSSKAGILGRIAAKFSKVPIIIHTIHGLPFFKEQNIWLNKLFIYLEKVAARFTDKIICVSDSIIKEAVAAGIAPQKKFIKIYSGIELDKFKSSPEIRRLVRKKLNIPEKSLVIGKIARLFFLKGHEYLIQAASQIVKKNPEVRFLFIGDGILKEKLIAQAKILKIQNNIIFAGLIDPQEIPSYIQAVDVLAHVSLHEGLPRAVVQAFALGIPAVCFDVDGAKDVVQDQKNGFLIPAKDVAQLTGRLLELLENRELRNRMGENAQRIAYEFFDANKMVDAIDNLYKELLECGH